MMFLCRGCSYLTPHRVFLILLRKELCVPTGSSKPKILRLNLIKSFILKLLLLIILNGQVKVCHPQTDTLYRVHNGRNCQFQLLWFFFFEILPFVLGFPFLGEKVLVLVDSACKCDVDSLLMVSLWYNVDHLFLHAVTSLKDFLPRINLLFETRLEIMTQGQKLGLGGINASSRMFQALANSFTA